MRAYHCQDWVPQWGFLAYCIETGFLKHCSHLGLLLALYASVLKAFLVFRLVLLLCNNNGGIQTFGNILSVESLALLEKQPLFAQPDTLVSA